MYNPCTFIRHGNFCMELLLFRKSRRIWSQRTILICDALCCFLRLERSSVGKCKSYMHFMTFRSSHYNFNNNSFRHTFNKKFVISQYFHSYYIFEICFLVSYLFLFILLCEMKLWIVKTEIWKWLSLLLFEKERFKQHM